MRLKVSDCAKIVRNSYEVSKAASAGSFPKGVIANLNEHGAQAFVTSDRVLAIPGSNELIDWFKNFDVYDVVGKRFGPRDEAKSASGATYHAGFLLHAQQIHDFAVENKVKFIVGHSLGAAAAQILGAALNIPAVGFASPNVKRGARKIRHEDKVLNICRADDLVTQVPPVNAGFRKLGSSYNLSPPTLNPGIDHTMDHYIEALNFKSLEGKLPKSWG